MFFTAYGFFLFLGEKILIYLFLNINLKDNKIVEEEYFSFIH